MANTCPACGAENAPDARFCSSCGTPQYRACPSCGSEQLVSAAFCSSCGTALRESETQEDRLDEQQERRVVTVLFADLAGSTALGERLDPEDVRDVQGRLFELLNAQVARFGGTTEKFVGDAILAVFGIPQAHEDDAERAVRAALGAREGFDAFAADLRSRYGASVGLRIGVNTGEVVSSREAAARGELMVSGDAVNVAARLQQSARPGEILVGRRTRAATTRSVTYGAGREVEAKGKTAPVPAWEVLAVEAEPAARPSGSAAPLVGRVEELSILEAVAARTRREHVPQLVTLFGAAGVGKSRLVAELLDRVPDARVLKGRCLPYGEGITYWPLAEATKGHAGILDTDPVDVALGKLRAAVESAVGEGSAEVVESIAWTIGLADSDSPLATADPQSAGERLAEGWQRYVAALGSRGLAVIVIEDVHWGSASLLDLLEHVAMVADASVLVVCTARPEFLTERPTWGAGKQNAIALSLAPLSPAEAERLVAVLLGEAQVLEDVRRTILSSAEGNPFFLEEMLQMLIEEGALERRNGGWKATGRLADVQIPDSVHGVIAARLDLLDAGDREALRRCAVVGRIFWPAAVGVDEELVTRLAGTGLVSAHPASVMGGLREFRFKHALTRDVAYGSLARPERRDLHRRVAEWIQTVAPDREGETAELVGYHYREAIAYGEDDPAVARRAYDVLLAAGRAATRRAAFGAARELLLQALELAARDDDRAAAFAGLVEVAMTEAHWDEAMSFLDEADRLEGLEATRRSELLGWRSRVSWLTGRWSDALVAARGAVEALAGLPETTQLARALARRSQIEMLRNEPEAGESARAALAAAERVGDEYSAVNAWINVMTVEASYEGVPPDPDEVLAVSRRAAAIGAHEEASRVLINFTWSSTGFIPVERIEEVVAAGRDGLFIPANAADYLDLSIGWMVLAPAGRWEELDSLLDRIAEDPPSGATSVLVLRHLRGAQAFRRGDLAKAEEALAGLHEAALGSGEAQRTVPSACAVFPWLFVTGQREKLRSAAAELLESVADDWPTIMSVVPAVRALAAAEEHDLLGAMVASMRRARAVKARLAVSVSVGDSLLALTDGRLDEAVEQLREAVARDEELGFAFDTACLRLELARALAAAGQEEEGARVRAHAERFLDALGCVHPF